MGNENDANQHAVATPATKIVHEKRASDETSPRIEQGQGAYIVDVAEEFKNGLDTCCNYAVLYLINFFL
jgi:hypothetical protein